MGEGPLQVTPQRVEGQMTSQNTGGGGPGKLIRNGNTFYSDGSMRTNTTSTTMTTANRLKQKQQMSSKLQVGGNKALLMQQQMANSEAQAAAEEDSQQQMGVMGVNRGPIKATRHAALMKKEDSQRSLQANGANSKLAAI